MSGPGLAAQIQAMEPTGFWILAAFTGVFAAVGLWLGLRYFRKARLIADTPTAKVRSAPQGYVELEGRGELLEGEPVVARLTARPCTWYRYRIERREVTRSNGKSRTRWSTLHNGTSDALFLLVDDTGQCIVDPEGASVTARDKDVWYGKTEWPRIGPGGASPLFGGRYRYTEERMHPGDPLYALGEFRTVGGTGDLGDARAELRELLASWKRDEARMRSFDTDGDGQVSPAEWEAARRLAAREVANARAERAASGGTDVLRRPEDRARPFLLSVLPQDSLVRRFHWATAGGIALFFSAGTALVWLLNARG